MRFDACSIILRAPPRPSTTSAGQVLVSAQSPQKSAQKAHLPALSVTSSQFSETRGSIGIAGTDVSIIDTVVSNHTGPLLVCAPNYRGGGGTITLHGLAMVHNNALNGK